MPSKPSDQYKRACAVVLIHDGLGHIVLGYSHKHKDWELPGGKHELKETSKQAAIRECLEECGIGLKEEMLEFIGITESERSLCVNYSARIRNDITPTVMEPKKHKEWAWFSIDKLPKPLRPECIEVLRTWQEKQ